MAVSKRLRYEILRRDNHTCRYCGGTAPDVVLTVDHVIPVALGGSDLADNLVAACKDCNAGKSASSPDAKHLDDVSQAALRWRHAMQFAAEQLEQDRKLRDCYRDDFEMYWTRWGYTYEGERKTFELPVDWRLSIDAIANAGLSTDEIEDSVQECMYRNNIDDRFRYFCGISWNKIKQQQATALEYAEYVEHREAREAGPQRVHLGWPLASGRVL